MKSSDENENGDFLNEVVRVLKPGGQVLIALQGIPEILNGLSSLLGFTDGDRVGHIKLLRWMEKAGLSDVSWRITGPMSGLAMGWKQHEAEACD